MHPEIGAHTVEKLNQTTDDPIALGSFIMHPNSLGQPHAGMQTVPLMNHFSNPSSKDSQIYHQYQSD
jgi:hypothetical protein